MNIIDFDFNTTQLSSLTEMIILDDYTKLPTSSYYVATIKYRGDYYAVFNDYWRTYLIFIPS